MTSTLPISLQLYTVRDALAADWEGTLEKVAEMGYVGVETAGFSYAPSMETAIAKIKGLGLEISGAHSGLPLGDAKNEALEMMAALENSRLICAWVNPENFASINSIKALTDQFNEASGIAKAAGLSLGFHNHWFEYWNVDGRNGLEVMIAEGLDDDVFFEMDTYWAQTARANVVEELNRFGSRVPIIHVKDGPTGHASNMTAVGQGVMDFHTIIPAAKSAEWLVVELDRCDTDMMTAVKESIEYLTAEGLGRGK